MPTELISSSALDCLDLADLQEIKASAVAALKAVLAGEQSYDFAGRRVTRADIAEIQAVIQRIGHAIAIKDTDTAARTVVPDFRTANWNQ